MSWRETTQLIVTNETRTREALRMRHLSRAGAMAIVGGRFVVEMRNFDGL
jgi:hypothetical protein